MQLRYSMKFLMRDARHDFRVETTQVVSKRVEEFFQSQTPLSAFVVFRTAEKKCIALNMTEVQAIKFLSDVTLPPAEVPIEAGPVQIQFRGRKHLHEGFSRSDIELADFINGLEHGPEVVPTLLFVDSDGEGLRIDKREVVCVIASGEQVDEGYRQLERDSEAG